MKARVVVVDDSAFIRRVLQEWIGQSDDFEVVGVGHNGEDAVRLVRDLRPDVVTLDVEMPVRDGISALEEIMATWPTPVLMVSSVTQVGGELTMKALELGAYDFVSKPQGSTSLQFLQAKDELLEKLSAWSSVKIGRKNGRAIQAKPAPKSDKVVVITSSTGGPRALATLFEALPKSFSAPLLIVQHMPVGFTETFAKRLTGIGTVPCREAKSGDVIMPGQAFLAPAGEHMTIGVGGIISLNDDPFLHGVRPAADYLFSSAAHVYRDRALGIILTGMGRDGAEGAVKIRKAGGIVFGESEKSCVVYGMPKAAKALDGVTDEFCIEEMAVAIVAALGAKRCAA